MKLSLQASCDSFSSTACAIGFSLGNDYQSLVNLVTYSFASISALLFFWHSCFRRRKKNALIWYRRALWARIFQINTIIVYWVTVIQDDQQPRERCWRMDGMITTRNEHLPVAVVLT